ncbi:hypothetical protein DSM106972_010070 [Dulcicalothrix desertica PCC 7102]|uniref:Uncharacterized protein n=1 Tax=Dulcicalothrix desertica PCC 7102 TaxID=232991 RepID=A0A3S1AQY8_9CYAN|nr:hypothetical protein [Dulcicalothrix desertica]RUT08954.1 hypothetical protein DSM106972_010070 [Dulcicalothrix desertica PCC 7102]TWH49839.1 hypothetical protein CAL7102_04074 [Dulcicalothrix desertica PCC 7102]
MSYIHLICQFWAHRFPFWGICQLQFDPKQKTLYFYCQTPAKRTTISKDADAIANLDIGIEQFVVVQQGYPDIVIQKR